MLNFPTTQGNFFGQFFCYRESIYLYKMKKLNSNDIFDIFSIGDEEIYKEHKVEDLLNDSFIQFGMAIRGVENYFIIDKMYASRYGEKYDSVRGSIKIKYFNGLVNYLERIKLSQLDTPSILMDEFGPQAIKYALEEMLDLYEEKEMYEKCAIIFKFYELFFIK